MWILYNLAHKFTKIQSKDGDAWIRVLGFFKIKDDAFKHAKKLSQYQNVEIRIAPQNEFRVLLRTDYKVGEESLNREREIQKYHFLMDFHEQKRKVAKEEVYQNAKERVVGEVSYDKEDIPLQQQKTKDEDVFSEDDSVKRILRDQEIRMQRFCSFAIVPDYESQLNEQKTIEEWIEQRAKYFSTVRNSQIHLQNLNLNVEEIMKEWVKLNPVPENLNVYGQCSTGNPFEKNETCTYESVSYRNWKKLFQHEFDMKVWKLVGFSDADLEKRLNEYNQEHQCPLETNGHEPMIAFLDVANDEEEIRKKVTENIEFQNYDIGCVAMYEWVKVSNAFSSNVKKTYREKTMNELHEKIREQQYQADILKKKDNFKLIEIS